MFVDEPVGLFHMLDAAKEAVFLAKNRDKRDLQMNRVLANSLVECLGIVGEAAAQIPQERQNELSELPWQKIISIRQYLNQTDFEINLDIVWEIVTTDLPRWIGQMEQILAVEAKVARK
jgi:uncharacterized protein with HEPN domain